MKKCNRITMSEIEDIAKKIKVNKRLDKYENMNLFPEKLERANQLLKNVKLPK